MQYDGALCWAFRAPQILRITESQHEGRPVFKRHFKTPLIRKGKQLPSFFGTQSTPNVNFLICNTKYSGKEAKREVLRKKITTFKRVDFFKKKEHKVYKYD